MKFITISDTKGNECFLNLEAVVAIESKGDESYILLASGRNAGTTGIFTKAEADRVRAALQELQDEAVQEAANYQCKVCQMREARQMAELTALVSRMKDGPGWMQKQIDEVKAKKAAEVHAESLKCGYCHEPMVGGPRCSHCGGQ